uniref:Predicted gene 16181 n=1 Tax=Mus spicilegus TaxID=10103 RepID=A0A8C6MQB4_MUSSI
MDTYLPRVGVLSRNMCKPAGLYCACMHDNPSRRDGSVVKSTDCSSRDPEFKSQQPPGGSQPSVMRSDALFWGV